MQQQDEYQKLLELCKDVIPITWNAYKYCDIENYKKKRGILNVELDIYDKPTWNKNSNALGHVRGLRYVNGVGHIKISIHCYSLFRAQTLLHELAHVAVFRLQSLITKSYKVEYDLCDGRIIEPDSHGEIFYKFFNVFENRAIKKRWNFFVIKDTKIWRKDK